MESLLVMLSDFQIEIEVVNCIKTNTYWLGSTGVVRGSGFSTGGSGSVSGGSGSAGSGSAVTGCDAPMETVSTNTFGTNVIANAAARTIFQSDLIILPMDFQVR